MKWIKTHCKYTRQMSSIREFLSINKLESRKTISSKIEFRHIMVGESICGWKDLGSMKFACRVSSSTSKPRTTIWPVNFSVRARFPDYGATTTATVELTLLRRTSHAIWFLFRWDPTNYLFDLSDQPPWPIPKGKKRHGLIQSQEDLYTLKNFPWVRGPDILPNGKLDSSSWSLTDIRLLSMITLVTVTLRTNDCVKVTCDHNHNIRPVRLGEQQGERRWFGQLLKSRNTNGLSNTSKIWMFVQSSSSANVVRLKSQASHNGDGFLGYAKVSTNIWG